MLGHSDDDGTLAIVRILVSTMLVLILASLVIATS